MRTLTKRICTWLTTSFYYLKVSSLESSTSKSKLSKLIRVDKYFLYEKLKELGASESLKRPEENYKFVFKRCLKHMKEDFKNLHPEKLKKKDFERSFYEHYFQAVVKKHHIPIESFFHPKNSKTKTKDSPKTINAAYVDNISKSEEFVHDFTKYLNQTLETECREIIDSKINGLIQKWESEYEDSNHNEKIIGEISDYIEKNKKCKLPWTVKEVQEAIASVWKLFGQDKMLK